METIYWISSPSEVPVQCVRGQSTHTLFEGVTARYQEWSQGKLDKKGAAQAHWPRFLLFTLSMSEIWNFLLKMGVQVVHILIFVH